MFGHNKDESPNFSTQKPDEPVADATLSSDDSSNDTLTPANSQPPDEPITTSHAAPPAIDDADKETLHHHKVTEPEGLLAIKQQALEELNPLISQLDQTPEEKFKTTMMMIQATDNDKLIKTAYEAAKQIGDEKLRAQALLDIVNEINYFTQN